MVHGWIRVRRLGADLSMAFVIERAQPGNETSEKDSQYMMSL